MNGLKDALEALKKFKTDVEMAEAKIGLINDAAGIASLIVTRTGRVCEVNHTAAKLLGYVPHELQGCMLMQLMDESLNGAAERRLTQWLAAPLAPISFALRDKGKQLVTLQMAAHRVSTQNGELAERMVLIWANPEHMLQDKESSLRTLTELQQLSDKLMAAQEKERKRLAQELHDGVAQALTMIKFTLEETSRALELGQQERALFTLRSSADMVREALDDARRIAQDLWPSSLDNLGLLPTIGAYCRQFTDAQPHISISNDLFVREHDVPEALRVDIFRVMQECLRNVAQHASARSVRVILRITSEGLLLTVKDDGVGFDAQQMFYGQTCLLGIGLRSMRERLHSHHGQLQVQSRIGEGTTISALWQLPAVDYSTLTTTRTLQQHDEEFAGLSPFAVRPARKARRKGQAISSSQATGKLDAETTTAEGKVIALKRGKGKAA